MPGREPVWRTGSRLPPRQPPGRGARPVARRGGLAALSRNPSYQTYSFAPTPYPNFQRGRPFHRIQPKRTKSMEARMRPIGQAWHAALFDPCRM